MINQPVSARHYSQTVVFNKMLHYIRKNINRAQNLAKERIGEFLENKGYSLTLDEHNLQGIETRVFQWTNPIKKHTV